ncbi:MAG: hypothetical protein JW782_06515 [Candidatus Saganbacteria bacterium]|nr:hypothetical protein [Candidatus Saganbacteria bacterium]
MPPGDNAVNGYTGPLYYTPLTPMSSEEAPFCSAEETAFDWYGDHHRDVDMRPYWAPPIDNLSVIPGTVTPSLSTDSFGAFTPDVYTELTGTSLAAGRSSSWVVINLSGLKHVNDHFVGGHEAGNAYLRRFLEIIRETAIGQGMGPEQVRIVRDGPNFVLEVTSPEVGQRIMDSVLNFSAGVEITYEHNRQQVRQALTPEMLDSKVSLVNTGMITFDAAELSIDGQVHISEESIYRALREQIYILNRPESSDVIMRFNDEHIIDANEAGRLESYRLDLRLPDYQAMRESAASVTAPEALRHTEPRSGLRNYQEMILDGADILRSGSAVRFAFFDGNAMGSFRSLGFAGEAMMDAVVEVRMADAAARAGMAEAGITLYRHGSGSEEFYLVADEGVSPETMEQVARDFMFELNNTPFEIRVETSALLETEMGRLYLDQNPNAMVEVIDGVEYTRVDITEVTRGRSGVEYRGLTVTLGHGTIQPPADGANVVEFFRAGSQLIMEHGEAAKNLNPSRRNVLLEVTSVNGETVGRIIPLEAELSNPCPLENEQSSMIDRAAADSEIIDFQLDGREIIEERFIPLEERGNGVENRIEIRTATAVAEAGLATPEARIEAVIRSDVMGQFQGFPVLANGVRLSLADLPGITMPDGGTLLDLNNLTTLDSTNARLLRNAGIESIYLPPGVEPTGEILITEETLRTAQPGDALVVDQYGYTEVIPEFEINYYEPVTRPAFEAIRASAVSNFSGAASAIGIEIENVTYETLRQISGRSISELMQEYNISEEQARSLKNTAEICKTQAEYTMNVTRLAESLGVDINTIDGQRVAETVYRGFDGTTGLQLERLFDFFATEEGRAFLETEQGRQFAERLETLREAHNNGGSSSVTTEFGGLLVSLAVFLGAERLAHLLGIENPLAKTTFVLSILHMSTEAQAAGILSRSSFSAVGQAIRALGADLSAMGSSLLSRSSSPGLANFRSFISTTLEGNPLIFGRNSLLLRGAGHLISREALGRFFGGIGHFTILAHAYDAGISAAGLEDTVMGHQVTRFIVPGIAMIGINRLIATRLANTIIARAWTKVLGPIGIAFFIADIVDMAHLAFMDEYTRSLTLRARDEDYNGTDPFLTNQLSDCAEATRSWLGILGMLRLISTPADNYNASGTESFDRFSASQFDREALAEILITLSQENEDFREAIIALRMIDPTDVENIFSENGIRHAVDVTDLYFNDDGTFDEEMIDQFISRELFRSYETSDVYRAGNDRYRFTFNDEVAELDQMTLTIGQNRRIMRAAALFELEQLGLPLEATELDIASGLVTADGQLNHASYPFQQLASRLVQTAARTNGPEAAAMLTQIRLNIINLRLEYLRTNDSDILRELDAWGDEIDVPAWHNQQAEMQQIIEQTAALELGDPTSALIFAGLTDDIEALVGTPSFSESAHGGLINALHGANLVAINESAGNEQVSRMSVLYQRHLSSQPLEFTNEDISNGLVTMDGEFNFSSDAGREFAASLVYQASANPSVHIDLTPIRLAVLRTRVDFLDGLHDHASGMHLIGMLSDLDAWGDTISSESWTVTLPALNSLLQDFDPDNPEHIAQLNNLIPLAMERSESGEYANPAHDQNSSVIEYYRNRLLPSISSL